MMPCGAFPHVVQWPGRRLPEFRQARSPLRGQCRTLTGFPVCTMEEALPQVIHAEPLERKLLKAHKKGLIDGITWEDQLQDAVDKSIVSREEADILSHVRGLVLEIIAVDEFTTEELAAGRKPEPPVDTQHAA